MTDSGVVSTANLVIWVVIALVALWRTAVLVRPRSRTRGRITVAVLFGTSFLSNTFELSPVAARLDAVAPGLPNVLTNVTLVGFFCGFIYFFSSSVSGRLRLLARIGVQVWVAVAVSVLLVAAWWITPDGVVDYQSVPAGGPPGPFLFNVLASAYLGYASLVSAVLARSGASAAAGSRWRWSLEICAAGLALCFLGGPALRVPSIVLRWARLPEVPAWAEAVGLVVLTSGIVLVLVGLSLVAARSALDGVRLWRRARRGAAELRPLWDALRAAFPRIVLHPPRGRVGEALRLRSAVYTYRRRVIECRDGLWLLSAYADDEFPGADRAGVVRGALERFRRGEQGTAPGRVIAGPGGDGSREEEELLALSRALGREPDAGAAAGAVARAEG